MHARRSYIFVVAATLGADLSFAWAQAEGGIPPTASPETPGSAVPQVAPVAAGQAYYPYWPPPHYPPGDPPPGIPPYAVARRAPGAETHDGFYLRLQLGLNWTGLTATGNGSQTDVSGAGASMALALGGAATDRLIIYWELFAAGAADPETRVDGVSRGITNGTSDVSGMGPGLAYYLPSNVFVAGTAALARVAVLDNDDRVIADSGFGFTFVGLVGKEWWASDNWGLGISTQVMAGVMKGKTPFFAQDEIQVWRVLAGSVLFSATFN
jgi:hypothetical protein